MKTKMALFVVLVAILGLAMAGPILPKPDVFKPSEIRSSRVLNDDLNQILALIPIDSIKTLLNVGLSNDGALVTVVNYLQGQSWRDLVTSIGEYSEVQELIEYLTVKDVPIRDLIASIRAYIDRAVPTIPADANGTLRPLIDAIKSLIPSEEIKILLNDLLQTSSDLQELYQRLSSDKSRGVVERVRALDEVIYLSAQLEGLDVDVDGIWERLYELLGWSD